MTGATDTAGRAVHGVGWHLAVALGGIAGVRRGELTGVDGRLGGTDPTGRFQAADGGDLLALDEPVPRRHRRAVVEQGVADHHRLTVFVADDDVEATCRRAAEQCGDLLVVVSTVAAVGIGRGGGPLAPPTAR